MFILCSHPSEHMLSPIVARIYRQTDSRLEQHVFDLEHDAFQMVQLSKNEEIIGIYTQNVVILQLTQQMAS